MIEFQNSIKWAHLPILTVFGNYTLDQKFSIATSFYKVNSNISNRCICKCFNDMLISFCLKDIVKGPRSNVRSYFNKLHQHDHPMDWINASRQTF